MLMKLCPRCRKIISQSNKYCEDCQKIIDNEHSQHTKSYNKTRDKKYINFYHSKDWKLLKNKKLSDADYLCEVCKKNNKTTIAEDVHHVEPLKQNWNRRLDYSNLLAVCVSCHNKLDKRF